MAREIDWEGILSSMEMLLLERMEDGKLEAIGQIPDWCRNFQNHFQFRETSPFLDNFLFDAEKFWSNPTSNRYRSGIWVESDDSGTEHELEAFAILAQNRRMVLIQRVPPEERQDLIQKAREKSLANIRLVRSERNARKSEQRLHKLLDGLPDWIFRVQHDGTLMDLKVSTGRNHEAFVPFLGKNISEIFPGHVTKELMNGLRRAKETGEMQIIQFKISLDESYESRIIPDDQGEALFILRELF